MFASKTLTSDRRVSFILIGSFDGPVVVVPEQRSRAAPGLLRLNVTEKIRPQLSLAECNLEDGPIFA
jgi:hypothetical protein